MNELLSLNLQSNNVTDDDFASAYNVIVDFMRRQQITTICNNEAFFANLYNRHALLPMLERGVPLHLWSTLEHTLLYCYALHKPFRTTSDALAHGSDSNAIAAVIGVTAEYARTDNVFERAFDAMVVAVARLLAPGEEQQGQADGQPSVQHWRQHEWSSFTDALDEYEKSFDCAEFFYNIFVNAPPTRKQHSTMFDAKYNQLWKKIQTDKGAECVSHVAWLLCNEPPLLALIRNRRGDGSDGLFASMTRCCERVQLLDSLRLAMNRRARALLRRTTVTYTAKGNHIDVCVPSVQHAFAMGRAVLDWCRLVDASVGRLGEGAARLRCYFAETELPMVDRDATMFLGFDRIPTTVVQWHCAAEKTDGFTLYGSQIAINVRVMANSVETAGTVAENAVATVQLLFGDRSSFDSILCCLYYAGWSRDHCSLNALLEPLLLLPSARRCASKAIELMQARRASDRLGHVDAFHCWPTIVFSVASSSSSSSTSVTSSSSSSVTASDNVKRRKLFADN